MISKNGKSCTTVRKEGNFKHKNLLLDKEDKGSTGKDNSLDNDKYNFALNAVIIYAS